MLGLFVSLRLERNLHEPIRYGLVEKSSICQLIIPAKVEASLIDTPRFSRRVYLLSSFNISEVFRRLKSGVYVYKIDTILCQIVSHLLRFPLQLHHLHIPFPPVQAIPFPPWTRKLAFKSQLPRRPLPEPNQPPNDAKDDANHSQDPKAISGNTAAAFARVEE